MRDMSCDRCGVKLAKGSMCRLRMDRSVLPGRKETRWVTDEFVRYYCSECAREAKKAVRKFEISGDAE